MMYSIAQLNQLDQTAFVEALGEVFEDMPAIAQRVWHQRPFANVTELHQRMIDEVHALNRVEQLMLIRAHPDLGSKAKMAEASVQEQAGAGLDRLTPDEYDRFQALNQTYKDKFDFPFIVAVKHRTKASILAAFDRRLDNSADAEIQHALAEIAEIARFRLLERVEPS